MYGMINQGIKDLVIQVGSIDIWNKICEDAESPVDFVSMHYYDDAITYRLVEAASQTLNLPTDQILKTYGNHWIQYTSKEGYGPIMDLFGADFISCLMNLNHLHARMGMTMPHLKPPHFECTKMDDTTYTLFYSSERKGLDPMIIGLLEGLALKHGERVTIQKINQMENTTKFEIKLGGKI